MIAKIVEKGIAIRIKKFLEEQKRLADCQFGFSCGKDTVGAVLNLISKIIVTLDNAKDIVALLCNLSKAFDCVTHSLILNKLK